MVSPVRDGRRAQYCDGQIWGNRRAFGLGGCRSDGDGQKTWSDYAAIERYCTISDASVRPRASGTLWLGMKLSFTVRPTDGVVRLAGYQQLPGWNLPPLVNRAVGAH